MDPEKDFWFGALNGMHVIYDPAVQLPGSECVLLFQTRLKRFIVYHKPHARSVLVRIDDSEKATAALAVYLEWRRAAIPKALEDAQNEARSKNAHLEERRNVAVTMHRRRLEHAGFAYKGVTVPDGRGEIRSTICRGCHRAVGTESHLLCNGCGWIVCMSCGTCGCGWSPDDRGQMQHWD